MITIEQVNIWGFEHAVRAMRNPMNSWERSDSRYHLLGFHAGDYVLGEHDLDLMKRLYKSGSEHRTYARMIQVSMDIVAPLYWWKEMDRYTVGKSQVSCSTMHRIAAKEFEPIDFSFDHIDTEIMWGVVDTTLAGLNFARKKYLEAKQHEVKKVWWWQMIQLLPSSYNQRRTVCMSYETIFKIIKERSGHKLDEWNEFVDVVKDLPYVKEIMQDE